MTTWVTSTTGALAMTTWVTSATGDLAMTTWVTFTIYSWIHTEETIRHDVEECRELLSRTIGDNAEYT